MSDSQLDHENYHKCVIGLIKLHGLDLLGMNDSIEADKVRDDLDKPYGLLPRNYVEDLAIINGFLELYLKPENIDKYKK